MRKNLQNETYASHAKGMAEHMGAIEGAAEGAAEESPKHEAAETPTHEKTESADEAMQEGD
jgi:hypothetical protein